MTLTNAVFLILTISTITQCNVFFHNQIYSEFHNVWPCIARSNGTHTVGCSSSRNGNVGVLHFVLENADLKWVLESGPMSSYIVVMDFEVFSREKLELMNNSSKVQGVVLIPNSELKPLNGSPDYKCPNQNSVLKGTCNDTPPWNVVGDGLLWEWWDMPIFYSDNSATINEMYNCFKQFNFPLNSSQVERSLCALELTSYMNSRGLDSGMCLRKEKTPFGVQVSRFCDKLGDVNIVAPVIPFQSFEKKKYIVLAVRLDSATFFYGRAPAVLSTVTSLVALIMAAKLLNELTEGDDFDNYEKNVLFVFFNGEAYDFIGSSKFVFDISRGLFPNPKTPMSLNDIDLYVELSQIAVFHSSEGAKLFAHYPNKSPHVSKFLEDFNSTKTALEYKFDFTDSFRPLPPSSVHSFLKIDPTFPGMVLGAFNDMFKNGFYHSVFDDWYNLKSNYNETRTFIHELATTLAHTVYKQVTGKSSAMSIRINETETEKVLECYAVNFYCNLIGRMGFSVFGSHVYPNFYIGVGLVENPWLVITKYLLIYYMSREIPEIESETECTNPKAKNSSASYYVWDEKNQTCRVTNVGTTLAVSPAFEIDNYDMKSFNFSTWSESTWDEARIRLFMVPSAEYEWQAILFGGVILYFSFIFTYVINNRAVRLFVHPNPSRKMV